MIVLKIIGIIILIFFGVLLMKAGFELLKYLIAFLIRNIVWIIALLMLAGILFW